MELRLTPAGTADRESLDRLIRAGAADAQLAIGYPRCDDIRELLAELNVDHGSRGENIRLILLDDTLWAPPASFQTTPLPM